MIDRKTIERAARELGAAKFGIGDLSLFAGEDPRRDPKMVCPKAKCLIGFGIPVPKGLYKTMKDGSQFYTYTTLGVKAIDEEYFEIFLFKMASLIEDAGYDACLQRTTPNLKVKGDKTCNPETVGIYELKYASPVEAGKPPPDVILDFGKAARACGLGWPGRSGRIVNREFGPFMRYAFIITDADLETNPPFADDLCAGCAACAVACDAGCIDAATGRTDGADAATGLVGGLAVATGLDTWKCWEHYNKARGSALPRTQWGYQACLCGKKCDVACYERLVGHLP